jgi:SAM-dependent methyltransferase
MDRSSLSRSDFAGAVRSHVNERLEQHGHHPREGYTPLAFRHYVRRIAVLDALAQTPFQSALDVGCAEGFFMQAIHDRYGAEVWGVDISNAAVERLHDRLGFAAAAADAVHLPFADGAFDLVYSTEVIEHVLDPELMLAEMRRVARRMVLVTTPASQTPDEHEPDYELADEGHVNNFDRATVERVFGSDARLGSFRCNSSLALIVAVGRYMPAGIRDGFYAFDHLLAKRLGAPDHRFKPLRNRDWLITLPGSGRGEGRPGWRCPSCRGELTERADTLRCDGCGAVYRASAGAPDFFEPAVPGAQAAVSQESTSTGAERGPREEGRG